MHKVNQIFSKTLSSCSASVNERLLQGNYEQTANLNIH